jgi:phosphopentomutase
VIVLDGAGVGELPDAHLYGDEGSNTLGNLAAQVSMQLPTLRALGLGRLIPLDDGREDTVKGAVGRMAERSPGKDSVTGHWELMGVVLDRPFPVFPDGFPPAVIEEFARRTGRAVLGNKAASGTAILDEYGAEQLRTGALIVYTSADSVFQIAAHESIVPIAELYAACEIAYELVVQGLGVGRVIARPFVGAPGQFTRTANRRDYAQPPVVETLLDRLAAAGHSVTTIGKVDGLFAGRGIGRAVHTSSDDDGLSRVLEELDRSGGGLVIATLVDFDTLFGHRNDVPGYAANLERFDRRLGAQLMARLGPGDLLLITADHGNDPTTPSTDHSREYVPLFVTGSAVGAGIDLGIRSTFADVGQTLAEIFGVGPLPHGTSFLGEITAP